jgi:hypothetical protein
LGSGKCGSSSSRCHCSKKRYVNWNLIKTHYLFFYFDNEKLFF